MTKTVYRKKPSRFIKGFKKHFTGVGAMVVGGSVIGAALGGGMAALFATSGLFSYVPMLAMGVCTSVAAVASVGIAVVYNHMRTCQAKLGSVAAGVTMAMPFAAAACFSFQQAEDLYPKDGHALQKIFNIPAMQDTRSPGQHRGIQQEYRMPTR